MRAPRISLTLSILAISTLMIARPSNSGSDILEGPALGEFNAESLTVAVGDLPDSHLFLDRRSAEQRNLQGQTALIQAARQGRLEMVRGLLELGVQVNAQDNWGRSALAYALAHDAREIIALLVNHGARLNL